jgi:hypothetical protein
MSNAERKKSVKWERALQDAKFMEDDQVVSLFLRWSVLNAIRKFSKNSLKKLKQLIEIAVRKQSSPNSSSRPITDCLEGITNVSKSRSDKLTPNS